MTANCALELEPCDKVAGSTGGNSWETTKI